MLAKRCRDSAARESLVRRARSCAALTPRPGTQQIYEALVNEGPLRIIAARPRDQIVKNAAGAPVLRVRIRAKAVHLIVPRDRVTPATLQELTAGITNLLAAST